MANVLVTGGTGMIGKALTGALLNKAYTVTILTRKKPDSSPDERILYAEWDIKKQQIDPDAIAKADHIIHLAGANVGEKRWTKKRKQEIIDSRVKSARLLIKAMNEIPNRIKTMVSASGIGWYGPDPSIPNPSPFKEDAPAYDDFLGQTCLQWEECLEPAAQLGKRVVSLRTGIVLSDRGGALEEFQKPLRFGIATILGSGRQVVSWIDIKDLVRIYIKAIEDTQLSGPYNAVTPHPASNKQLVLALAKMLKGKFYVPVHVPTFVLKLVLGEMSIEVLKSATVNCDKIMQSGFTFQFPTIASALATDRRS
jgi:uncharacterized protein (TIGR01777 family)